MPVQRGVVSWTLGRFTTSPGAGVGGVPHVNQWLTTVSTIGLHRVVDEIIQAKQALDLARARLDDAVQAARAQGRSWNDIGSLLGMSRQAAFKRFGRPVDPRNGVTMPTRTIAGLADATESAFRLIAQGQHDELQNHLAPQVRSQLTPKLIGDVWVNALGMVGTLEGFEQTHIELHDGTVLEGDDRVIGTVIGATVLCCEAGELVGRVAFDESGAIVGILIVPTNHGPLPF